MLVSTYLLPEDGVRGKQPHDANVLIIDCVCSFLRPTFVCGSAADESFQHRENDRVLVLLTSSPLLLDIATCWPQETALSTLYCSCPLGFIPRQLAPTWRRLMHEKTAVYTIFVDTNG